MVTWDESWSFTVTYGKLEAAIDSVIIVEADGTRHHIGRSDIERGGVRVTVKRSPVKIQVNVKNAGNTRGTLVCRVEKDGVKVDEKSYPVDPNVIHMFEFPNISLTGTHSITVRVRH